MASITQKQSEPSIVFTNEWIQTVEKRYGQRPRSLKSWPFLIATDHEFSSIRQQIENWVASLPETAQIKMVPNLRSTDNFWHTYHELIVGIFLKNLGLQVEFENKFGEQTPDWFVRSKNGSQSLIVEVFTVNISESQSSEEKQLAELTRRLAEIPLDFFIKISCKDNSAIKQLDAKRCKTIAEAVRNWLQTYNWQSEPSFAFDGFVFEMIHRDCGYPTLQYACPVKLINAAWTPLREKIEEKIHKYKNLVTANKIPLVVAVAPGLESDYTDFEMRNVLLGGVFVESPTSDGLFAKEPLLSAALFIKRTGMAEWKIHPYPNLKATLPLPEKFFEVSHD
jgi:hypothetical protein